MNTSHSRNRINPLLAVLAAGILSGCGKNEEALPPAPPPAAVEARNQTAPAVAPQPGFEKLKGKWLRPDGGYIVDIRSVESDGKMDAAYSNPRPIHVARAEASRDGTALKLFIELRDVNYPGSTYNLIFDPRSDSLKGIYYQAALQKEYEVVFVRTQ